MYLLGKHKAAIDVYNEAWKIGIEDWAANHLSPTEIKQFETDGFLVTVGETVILMTPPFYPC